MNLCCANLCANLCAGSAQTHRPADGAEEEQTEKRQLTERGGASEETQTPQHFTVSEKIRSYYWGNRLLGGQKTLFKLEAFVQWFLSQQDSVLETQCWGPQWLVVCF